jgi:hypothetical protein
VGEDGVEISIHAGQLGDDFLHRRLHRLGGESAVLLRSGAISAGAGSNPASFHVWSGRRVKANKAQPTYVERKENPVRRCKSRCSWI